MIVLYPDKQKLIKPGEQVTLYPKGTVDHLKVTPEKHGEAPFEMNGKQMMPRVYIGFE